MSIDAVGWAIGQKTLSPAGKLALIVIAESANIHRNHVCDYHDQATLADRASMSVDTLQKRIKDLVELDLLFVVKRRASDGSVFKNYYVVLIDDDARRHAAANGWIPRTNRGEAETASDRSEERTDDAVADGHHAANCGLDHAANQSQPCRKSEVAMPHCSGMAYKEGPELDRKVPESPPTPQEPGQLSPREGDASRSENRMTAQDRDRQRLERWDRFRRLWPWDASELIGEARAVFLALSDEDQLAAIDGAPRYVAACCDRQTRARNHGIAHAKRWLSGEGWAALKARSVESAASIAGRPFTIRKGSPQAAAWAHYETVVYGAPRLKFFHSKALGEICTRPTEWPPSAKGVSDAARDGPADHVA
jgi:hypothetical protein